MKRLGVFSSSLCCALALAALTPTVRADDWNKKTFVTFSNRVEVPGATLEPGKYVLKLVESPADRHIVQVMNERENKVFATILAIPNYRLQPTGKTVVTFYEMPAGQPPALRAWFYPGDNFGQEFAYPKNRATEISDVTHTTVPEAPAEVAAEKTSPAETPAAEPARPEEPRPQPPVEAQPAPAPAPAPEPAPAPAADTTPTEMPRTASDMPLIALIGMLSVISAIGVRTFVRRTNS
jgi:hypothetical protein